MTVKWVKDIGCECMFTDTLTVTNILVHNYTKYYTIRITFYDRSELFFTRARESSAEESVNRLVKTLYLKCYLI